MNLKPLNIAMPFSAVRITFFVFVGLFLFVSESHAQDTYDQKHIEVSLRMIGHQILLYSNDSTSRVLPIIKREDQYKIQFESEFEFNPEDLVVIVDSVVKQTKLAKGYIVEMIKCKTEEVVYSFEMEVFEEAQIIPCKTRNQPKACYSLLFTLMDTTAQSADLDSTLTTLSHEPKIEASQVNYILPVLILVLIAAISFFLWKRKEKPVDNPNLIPLGGYHFDKLNTELLIEDKRIELTNKEADLLLLLHKSANKTVEREVILSMVWGDEGDYVGRTLDVFISKLRKKLQADSSIKIVNTRGVGYKLVIQT